MPWRLIIFIIIFALFLVFITFNLDNKCDISFGFTVIEGVPVFITVFSSFLIGFLCALPLIVMIIKKVKHQQLKGERTRKEDPEIESGEYDSSNVESDEKIKKDAAEAKKRFFFNRKGAAGSGGKSE